MLNNRNITKKQGFILIISFIVLLFTADIWYSIKDTKREDKAIRAHEKITPGTIESYSPTGRNGEIGRFKITYSINGIIHHDFANGNVGCNIAPGLVGKTFPVLYDSTNTSNAAMLIFPGDFEDFGLAYPDSLEWLRSLLKACETTHPLNQPIGKLSEDTLK